MKITSTTACVVAVVIPLVATFTPGIIRHRPSLELRASADDVPDIVKAYKKAKAEPTLPELPAPTTTTPVPPPVVSESLPSVTTNPIPETPSFSMPEIKVELPPSANEMSADLQSSVSESIESARKSVPNSMQATADQINAQFKGINDFFKASQEQTARVAAERGSSSSVPTLGEMIEKGFASRRAGFTETSGLSVPEGKAPTMAEWILGGFQSSTGGASVEGLAESKAKFALLVHNTYSLFGASSPENVDMNLPDGMSPETAATFAVASVGLLVVAGTNNRSAAKPSSPTSAVTVDAVDTEVELEEIGPLSGLTKDVKKMAEQIQKLSEETKNLRAELKEARDRINKKELEISKEKLKTADGELKLKRELEKVSVQLRASEAKNKALEKELADNAEVMARIKLLEDQMKAAGITPPAPAPAPKPEPTPAPPTPAPKPEPTPAPPTPAPKPEPTPEASKPVPASEPTPEPVEAEKKKSPSPKKKTSEPAATAKKSPTPKRKSAGPKGSAAKAASPKDTKSPVPKATKAKAKSKAKGAKKADPAPAPAPAADSSDDWPSLSASTLSRKTVKELTEYLSDKGVETNDGDGKPLKKALLVDAVKAL